MKRSMNNQRGAVLIVGLLILVVLSLLGITTLQTSTIEEKMANNMGQRNLAFQAAEAGLRTAEARLAGLGAVPELIPAIPGNPPRWDEAGRWTGANSELISNGIDGLDIAGVAEQPRYIYEDMGLVGSSAEGSVIAGTEVIENRMYRITARGVGRNANAVVMLQSTYIR